MMVLLSVVPDTCSGSTTKGAPQLSEECPQEPVCLGTGRLATSPGKGWTTQGAFWNCQIYDQSSRISERGRVQEL